METTVAKPAEASRTSDRVLEALATLAVLLDKTISEVKGLDRDFQARIVHAVQESEAALQNQAAARLQRAVGEAEARVRKEVTAELNRKFQAELETVLSAMRGEFESERERMNAAMDKATEKAAQLEVERTQLEAERNRLSQEIRRMQDEAAREAERGRKLAAERMERAVEEAASRARQEVTEELTRKFQEELESVLVASRSESEAERESLNRKLVEAMEAVPYLEAERARLEGELQRLRQEGLAELGKVQTSASEQMRRAVADAEARVRKEVTRDLTKKFQEELHNALQAARTEFEAEREVLNRRLSKAAETAAALETERSRLTSDIQRVRDESRTELERVRADAEAVSSSVRKAGPSTEVLEEIVRIGAKIKEISAVIEDPATELAVVIRKNVERSELESYIKGIRFVVENSSK